MNCILYIYISYILAFTFKNNPGSGLEDVSDDLLEYAHDTQHDKIIEGCAIALALVHYRREEFVRQSYTFTYFHIIHTPSNPHVLTDLHMCDKVSLLIVKFIHTD